VLRWRAGGGRPGGDLLTPPFSIDQSVADCAVVDHDTVSPRVCLSISALPKHIFAGCYGGGLVVADLEECSQTDVHLLRSTTEVIITCVHVASDAGLLEERSLT